jgi:hypothetical protein
LGNFSPIEDQAKCDSQQGNKYAAQGAFVQSKSHKTHRETVQPFDPRRQDLRDAGLLRPKCPIDPLDSSSFSRIGSGQELCSIGKYVEMFHKRRFSN